MGNPSCNPKVIHLLNTSKALGVTVFNRSQEEVGLTSQFAAVEFQIDVGEMPAMEKVGDTFHSEMQWIAAVAVAADRLDWQAANVAVRQPDRSALS